MAVNKSRIKRILQIAPVCGDIEAVFDHAESASHGESVVVWGLVETVKGTTEIHGFTTECDLSGYGLRSAEEDSDFAGYYKLSETEGVVLGSLEETTSISSTEQE